ncbi:MAG: ADP-forming succinate--CoA ligase subunit beta [Thermodesulfobacteriota bacterium]|nr:ADP-forming succinate--CoA ligase subunit beta [Thermodesulfobacteriota bacterium]
MRTHEYQAKELFKKCNIPTPDGGIAFDPDEARAIAHKIGGFPVVIKAQIHAGGRGKSGGIKLAESGDEVYSLARSIIGTKIVTSQTGPEGKLVRKVLVEKKVEIDKELYLSIIADRKTSKILIMASEAGGIDIEKTAIVMPEKIIRVYIDPNIGFQPFHCRKIAFGLKLTSSASKQFVGMLQNLYRLFVDYDCLLAEINPLVVTAEQSITALDAKIEIDDNALFRHMDIIEYRDIEEEDPLEVEASRFNLNYIKMDGNVGNMVNGAGLAMATMDIIKLAGAEPANFLDVGGGTTIEMVENGFRIILSDKDVKLVFINIFGGILRCDVLAKGIIQAAGKTDLNIPVVIRMDGTNIEKGRRIFYESGFKPIYAVDLKDAAQKISGLAGAGKGLKR